MSNSRRKYTDVQFSPKWRAHPLFSPGRSRINIQWETCACAMRIMTKCVTCGLISKDGTFIRVALGKVWLYFGFYSVTSTGDGWVTIHCDVKKAKSTQPLLHLETRKTLWRSLLLFLTSGNPFFFKICWRARFLNENLHILKKAWYHYITSMLGLRLPERM